MQERTLTAAKGKVYTNGKDYGRVIGLGIHDSPDNWHEITEEEYAERMREADDDMATDEDYQNSLESLGVNFNA